jgi:translation initiation factor IF-3
MRGTKGCATAAWPPLAADGIFAQVGAPSGAPIPGRRCRIDEKVRVNNQIRLSPVRLVDAEGQQVGVVPLEEARRLAEEAGLDLVEVAPDARPIVVRIMDWGKHRFETAKKAREARKKESRITVKQIKLRPNIDDHDLETKLAHARRFLVDGDKVKVTIMFRGRDLRRPENGRKVLDKVVAMLADAALVESAPGEIVNRDMSMVLGPRKH